MNHLMVVIPLLLNESLTFFRTAAPPVTKRAWLLMITLILKTDYGRHFPIVDQYATLNQKSEFNILKKNTQRELFMIILLKAATVSSLLRPWEYAGVMIPMLADEFFCECDLQTEASIEFDGPERSRDRIHKPKSTPGFLDQICHALVEVIAHYNPPLCLGVKPMEMNIAKYVIETRGRRRSSNAN
jgi:hypothetical protein